MRHTVLAVLLLAACSQPADPAAFVAASVAPRQPQATPGGFSLQAPQAGLQAHIGPGGTVLAGALRFGPLRWGREGALREAGDAPLDTPCAEPPEHELDGTCLRTVRARGAGLDIRWDARNQGLMQSFVLNDRPEGEGRIELRQRLDGARATVIDDGAGLELLGTDGRRRFDGLLAWDADAQDLPVHFEVEGGEIRILVDDTGARWPLTVDPLLRAAAWSWEPNSFAIGFGRFPRGGDFNGDGFSDFASGGGGADNGQTDEGRAFVFYGGASGLPTTPSWTYEPNLTNSQQGMATAVGDFNGDGYDDLASAATELSNGHSNEGRVSVFHGGPTGLTAAPVWTREGEFAGAFYGRNLDVLPNYAGTAYDALVIGAPDYDGPLNGVGIIDVIPGSASGLAAAPGWTVVGTQNEEYLGQRTCVGDANGDGHKDLIVMVSYWDGTVADEGKAVLYHGSASGLGTAAWTWESGIAGATLDRCSMGDFDGDGLDDVAFASELVSVTASFGGRIWVANGTGTGFTTPTTFAEGAAQNRFGAAVQLGADLDHDGYTDLLYGSVSWARTALNQGSVIVHRGGPDGLDPERALFLEGAFANNALGDEIAAVGDVNGDGWADIGFGSPVVNHGNFAEGRAEVRYGQPSSAASSVGPAIWGGFAQAGFGEALDAVGDVNGDGFTDVLIASPNLNEPAINAGKVDLFFGSLSGLATTPAWTWSSDVAGSRTGESVSAAGDLNGDGYADLLIGVPGWDASNYDDGRAVAFLGGPGGPGAAPDWDIAGTADYGEFGSSVAGVGDVTGDGFDDIVIGAPWEDGASSDQGFVRFYNGSAGGPVTVAARTWTGSFNDRLGTVVAGAGDINGDGYNDIVATAPGWDNGVGDQGAALVYAGAFTGPSVSASWVVGSGQFLAGMAEANGIGDIDGDGFADLAVGARYWDGAHSDGGRAWVVRGSAAGLGTSFAWSFEGLRDDAWAGHRIRPAGDLDADGHADLLVGAPFDSSAPVGVGRLAVVRGSSDGPLSPEFVITPQVSDGLAGMGFAGADVNGDGLPEIVSAETSATDTLQWQGLFQVFAGQHRPAPESPTSTLAGSADYEELGTELASAGDVNADGYDDLLAGSPSADLSTFDEGRASLFLGGPGGLESAPSWSLPGNVIAGEYGHVGPGGDVDGDGYDDFLVGCGSCTVATYIGGGAQLYLGGPTGPSAASAWTWSYGVSSESGAAVAVVGDVDADGYGDILVGAPNAATTATGAGAVALFYGAPAGPSTVPTALFAGAEALTALGMRVAPAGDINADGYADFVATGIEFGNFTFEGTGYLWFGGADVPDAPADWTVHAGGGYTETTFLTGVGDLNTDGYGDLAFSVANSNGGTARIYVGGADASAILLDRSIQPGDANASFGRSIAGGGDVNADGYDDIYFGAPFRQQSLAYEGAYSLYLGGAGTFPSTPEWRHDGGLADAKVGSATAVGDWNGDGRPDAAFGAPFDHQGGDTRGRVDVLLSQSGARPTEVRALWPAALNVGDLPIAQGRWSEEPGSIDIEAAARSHRGTEGVVLEVELEAVGQPFDGADTTLTDAIAAGPTQALRAAVTDQAEGPVHGRYRFHFEGAGTRNQGHGPWLPLGTARPTDATDAILQTHNLAPTAMADLGTVSEGGSVTVAVLANDTDPDNTLSYSSCTITVAPAHGGASVDALGLHYVHDGSETLSDSLTYTICDGGFPDRCETAEVSFEIQPVNDAPIAVDDALVVAEAGTVELDLSLNDVDPDSDPVLATFVIVVDPMHGTATLDGAVLSYEHGGADITTDALVYEHCDEQGDCDSATVLIDVAVTDSLPVLLADATDVTEGGTTLIPVLSNDSDDEGALDVGSLTVSIPALNGLATVVGSSIQYEHGGEENTADSFTYSVCDSGGQCASASVAVTVLPEDDVPEIADDSATLDEGAAATIPVLVNDHDEEGPLDASSLIVLVAPSYGTAEVQGSNIHYVHSGAEQGPDSLVYRVCDGGGACGSATVALDITFLPDPPLALFVPVAFNIDEGGSVAADASGSNDEEGAITAYAWDCTDDGSTDHTDALLASCIYPDDGAFTLRLTVVDGSGDTGTATAPVTVNNVAPTITSAPATAALASQAWSYAPTATDPGADTLAWSLAASPVGLTLDPATGALSWIPTPSQAGGHEVQLVVTDGDGGSDVQSFEVFVGLNDQDGDLDPDELDCDDTNNLVFHGAPEVCNGIDDDCDALIDPGFADLDGDATADCVDADDDGDGDEDTVDCAPEDATVGPSQVEVCDLADQDCNGATLDWVDLDGDGFNPCEGDCSELDAGIAPGQPELCNGIDDDCDDSTQEGGDVDEDGVSSCEGDCDDQDPSFAPGAAEGCDGLDQDCDGAPAAEESDTDADGYAPCEGDCDDGDPNLAPGAPELCDGFDGDCDGEPGPPAEDDPDGDGLSACEGDCGPFDPSVRPDAAELCDNADTDCVGGPSAEELDADGDGYTACAGDCDDGDDTTWPTAPESVNSAIDHNCDGFLGDTDADADGFSLGGGDCLDNQATVHPGAPEICDGYDSDCSGEALPEERADLDGDGAVDCLDCGPTSPLVRPGGPELCDGIDTNCDGAALPPGELDIDGDGLAPCAGDCADTDPLVRPGLAEDCADGRDNDCEGTVDLDTDHDHDGHSSCSGDCRDLDEQVFPGASEACNFVDDDCDLDVDEGWDADGDGHRPCTGDCDDDDATVYLLAPVVCDDGTDNDCLPSTQEEVDSDGDGAAACDEPGDCWEGNPLVGPMEMEFCNLLDDDCDGQTDEGLDVDGDGHLPCTFDCDDTDAAVSPVAAELCDGVVDDNCDGVVDDGCEPGEGTPIPEPPEEEAGCACATGEAPLGAGLGALLVAASLAGSRRRRSAKG